MNIWNSLFKQNWEDNFPKPTNFDQSLLSMCICVFWGVSYLSGGISQWIRDSDICAFAQLTSELFKDCQMYTKVYSHTVNTWKISQRTEPIVHSFFVVATTKHCCQKPVYRSFIFWSSRVKTCDFHNIKKEHVL